MAAALGVTVLTTIGVGAGDLILFPKDEGLSLKSAFVAIGAGVVAGLVVSYFRDTTPFIIFGVAEEPGFSLFKLTPTY